ncbi:ABC transporter permease [Hymenobacter rubripertinctus]|uniref:ABC transporter permease n=1 Tax=Hymenobacter rubripertinctus TaxID=2029981 RepID=UPI0036437028
MASPRAFGRAVGLDARTVLRVGRQLFVRNLIVQYRQSVLGYLWLLLPPLVLALTWTLLSKANILQGEKPAVPLPLFILTGIFLWQAFVETLNSPLQQLTSVRHTLAKVRVPHEAFVAAGMGVVVFNLLVRLAVLGAVMWWYGVGWHLTLLWVPLGLGALLALGLGIGWLVALLGLLYNDVANALTLGINLWFLVTPVVYVLPGRYAALLNLNPVTPLLLTTRNWLLSGQAAPSPGFWMVAALASFGSLLGWLAYRLAQPHLIARF